jgi:hypothetical protein
MLHAKMMPLLKEVYKGKIIDEAEAKLKEFGGQRIGTQVVEGITIAAVDQVGVKSFLSMSITHGCF